MHIEIMHIEMIAGSNVREMLTIGAMVTVYKCCLNQSCLQVQNRKATEKLRKSTGYIVRVPFKPSCKHAGSSCLYPLDLLVDGVPSFLVLAISLSTALAALLFLLELCLCTLQPHLCLLPPGHRITDGILTGWEGDG